MSIVNFLFETAVLKRLERTGWQTLGGHQETVAEHTYMVCVISYVLAKQLEINIEKVIITALFHDSAESRVGEIQKIADLYVTVDEAHAVEDIFSKNEETKEIISLIGELEKRETLESQIVHDADVLALCIELKGLIEQGNTNAVEWLTKNKDRLRLKEAKLIYKDIESGNTQDWWKKEREQIHNGFKKN
jgi:putative hydrolase of HD superfamily